MPKQDNAKEETAQPEEIPTAGAGSYPEQSPEPEQPSDPAPVPMNDALFIGDSRTVGLMEYSGISEADFFCSVGMSVFDT